MEIAHIPNAWKTMASNESILVENARLRMYQFLCLKIASITVLK